MGLFDDLIPDAPSSTGLFDDLLPKKGNAVADALKHDQDFQPTPEELSSGYKARMSLPDPGAIWKGAKTLATETIPAQWSKSQQQIADEGVPQFWNPSKFRGQAATAAATLGETALRGTAYLGDMLKTPLDAAIGEAAAEAQSPGNAMLRAVQMALGTFSGLPIPVSQRTPEQQSAAEQIWASRMRVAGKDERAMAPYHEGDKTFVPGALGAPAEFASNFVDPTMAVPAAKAAGLLKMAGKGAEAASMAGRLSNVAKEAVNTGGVVKKAAEAAAPALEKGAQLAGEGLDKVAAGLDKVQPVLDVGGLVKGGLPGAAGAHVVGRGVRAGVKWASKVRDASTGVRNIAKADWNSTWTVAQQLAKDSDAPVWLRRAASSSVAPMVESTIRGAGAVGEGALHGAAIGGAASMSNDTLTSEERGEFIGGGAVLGGGGAALGKGIGAVTGRNAQARQAHDWAVMAHEAIQSGAEPSTVLGASDATMSYAHSLKQLFKGAMPGGKDLTVRLMDGSQFAEAHPNEPTAVGSFVSSPDGTHEVRLNLDRPDADSRALHEGLGHALMESVVGNTPDAFERARAVFSPDEITTAAQQYATALHPELEGPDQQTWIAQQQANSTLRWGDRDAWILSELISEGAVQEAGGRSIRDMATPGFGSSLQRTLGRDKPFKVETASFFSGDVAAKLKSPELGQLVRGRVEQLGQFRPGIDEPKGNSVVVQKGDWGKKPFAPLHDLAKAPAQPPPLPRDPSQPPPLNPQPPTPAPQVPKGNDFVVVNPTTGAVVARPPAQTRKLVKNRQAAVDKAVPRDGTPASPGDVDPQVKFRTSPSGLVERSGTVLGKWFYDGNVFSETTKGYARKIEDAIKNGTALSGFYHEIGESARGWARSVGERYGNLTAEYKDFIPVGFLVSTAGNLLVRNYSLTAFERKAQTWGARKGALSLELWNGDVGTFKTDVQTYLKNHSDGRPGADGIGEQKRNVINAFLVGGNRSFEATNPLRPFAKGADREGIIRSYRLDRLETVEPSDITGFSQPKYESQLRNLSPKTLYRAGDSAEVGVKPFSSWSEDKETAEAYLNNPGFGGKTLRTESVPMGQVLDADTTTRRGMSDLAEKLGFSRSVGDEWFDNGWRYPWEESKRVKEALQNSGFDAIRYVDDYPQGAKTVVPLKDAADLSKASEPQFSPAPQTDTPEFKQWFKASKVVDASGAPVPVYHSSDSSGFTVFKKSPKDVGMHFGTPEQAEDRFDLKNKDRYFGRPNGQTTVPAFLSIQNPIRLPDLGEWNVKTIGRTLGELGIQVPENVKTVPQMRQFLHSLGHDGIVYKNIGELGSKWSGRAERLKNARSHAFAKLEVAAGNRLNKKGWASDPVIRRLPEFAAWDRADAAYSKFRDEHAEDSWAVFDPAQIKSSIANQGTFDAKNPDIRYSPKTLSEETISSTLPRNEEDTSRRLPIGRFRVDPATDGQTFAEAIRRTKTEHPFGFYGDTGSKLFLAQDKLAGVAVTDYGDLVSVFKHPESTADIRPILAEASQHALTLDAFDVNGFLPNLYAQFGFRPVARVAFNREFAPPGWRYDLAGEPDVVLMVKDPKGISGAPAVSKDYSTVKTQVPSVDYDTAVRLQAEAKARVAAQVQFSPSTDEAVQKMKTSALNLFYKDSADIPPATPKTKRTLDEVAPLLKKAAEDQWGRTITSSDITPDELQTIVNNGVEETKAALKASGKNAFDWYTHAIARAVEVMKVIHPEMKDDTAAKAANFPSAKAAELGMTLAMAITSQNLNVRMNTRFANEQFEALKRTGRFDASKEYGNKALAISSNLDLANALLDLRGWDGLREFVHKEFTVGELSKTISDTLGKRVTIAGRTADKVNGSAIFGPKIGQGFFQNLSGNFTPVTVDLWMRRTWGRWTGDVMEADPLTPARIARLLDAARTEKVATPAEVKTVRTVLRDSQPTFSDTTAEKLRSDPALRDVLTKWSYDLSAEWQNRRYKDIKMPVRPTDAEALRAGSLSLDQLAKKQRTALDALDRRFAGLKDKPKKSDWVKAQLTRMGHTETLDNKTISATRPEWAKAVKVVADAFGPIDAPTDQDRATITRVIMGIKEHLEAEGVKVTPADLQAILWYPEKDIWSKLMDGSGESDLKLSYDDEFLSLADAAGLGKEARSAIAEYEKTRASRGGEPDDAGTAPDVRPSPDGSAPK